MPSWFRSRSGVSASEVAWYGSSLGPALQWVLTGSTNLAKAETGLYATETRLDLMVVAVVLDDNLSNLAEHQARLRATGSSAPR